MPIKFAHEMHELIYQKVKCFLMEAPEISNFYALDASPSFYVTEGSAKVMIHVTPLENDATVRVLCDVVVGATTGSPEVLKDLAEANGQMHFAAFGLYENGDVFLTHAMLGAQCTRESLVCAVTQVAGVADAIDDELVEKLGGKRAIEPPTPGGTVEQRTDDPARRKVYPPKGAGAGEGKSFLFLFGLKVGDRGDQQMLARELELIDDDIETLTAAGYTVAVDTQATKADLLDAAAGRGEGVEGLAPAGIYWSAHGTSEGRLQTCSGELVEPSDLDPAEVAPSLRLVVFCSCYVGAYARTWRRALGGRPLVVGWGRPVTIERAADFLTPDDETETDLDDLLRRYLIEGAAIPDDDAVTSLAPAQAVAASGKLADLPGRLGAVRQMLGGSVDEQPTHLAFTVPLSSGRRHTVRVTVVESSEPFTEGEPLLAAEADVGELSSVMDVAPLLGTRDSLALSRVAIVSGGADAPVVVTQAFLPLARARDQDMAAMIYHVGERADALEHRFFGTDV